MAPQPGFESLMKLSAAACSVSASSCGGMGPASGSTFSEPRQSKKNGTSRQWTAAENTGVRQLKRETQVGVPLRVSASSAKLTRNIRSVRKRPMTAAVPSALTSALWVIQARRASLVPPILVIMRPAGRKRRNFAALLKAMANSSSVAESHSGTSLPWPAASASVVGRGSRSPSTTGPSESPSSSIFCRAPFAVRLVFFSCSSMSFSSGTERKPARSALTPASLAMVSVSSLARGRLTSARAPESEMAPRKSPRAAGIPSSVSTAPPPADCPAMVTWSGSPPNAEMFSRTHSRAQSQSRTPRFSGAPGMCPNPSKPSR